MRTPAALSAAAAALFVATSACAQDPEQIAIDNTWPRFTYLIVLLAALLVMFFFGRRIRLGETLRSIAIWLAVLVGLIAIYTFRQPLEDAGREMASVLIPGMALDAGEAVAVGRGYGGSFVLPGEVDGTPVSFVFDTGASMVVLSAQDAAQAGFAIDELDYRIPVLTAAGTTQVAPVRLDEVRIGSIVERNVRAAIARPNDLDRSLLGMTFLNRLEGYEVRRDRLVLLP